MSEAPPTRLRLVLVGGGHTHVQVIRGLIMRPIAEVELFVVLDRTEAVYSGMVPGFIAGDYDAHELTIDLVPLVRRAGGTVVLSAATAVDAEARTIEFADRAALAYDVASIDIGSSVRGLELPGVAEHALATRPIRDFVAAIDAHVDRLERNAGGHIVVVGAGAAGFEVACTLKARCDRSHVPTRMTLLTGDDRVLPGASERARRAALAELTRRDIATLTHTQVVEVHADGLLIDDERTDEAPSQLASDLVIWATGGAAHGLCAASTLPLDADGFIRVGKTLQVEGYRDLFAVGDTASFTPERLPKAGVYAVRQGPILDANLRAMLTHGTLRSYRPQRDFLSLLNVGDRRAIANKWGLSFTGKAAWRLKDWIDRRFMHRFIVLDTTGAPAARFPSAAAMGDESEPMLCGGCAAKVGADPLARALARLDPAPTDPSVVLGLGAADDAATVRLASGELQLATIDGFRGFSDDAYLVGQIAAQNALSDVVAKGGQPRHALAIVTLPELPEARSEEALYQVLSGVRRTLDAAGVSLIGGHSTLGPELFVGLSITGTIASEEALWSNAALRRGDALVLTRALGTGVVLAADAQGLAPGASWRAAITGMLRSNAPAREIAKRFDISAATDISGFGLIGHLGELLERSDRRAVIHPAHVPALPGAQELIERGQRSSLHATNRQAERLLESGTHRFQDADVELLFDPQTSGGLLLAVAPHEAKALVEALHAAGDLGAALIGHVESSEPQAASASGGDGDSGRGPRIALAEGEPALQRVAV